MSTKPIRVIVVDDSALVRRVVSRSLADDPAIEVIDTAGDPFEAKEKILRLKPDVVTLDIEMPRMDGLTFLSLIMKHRPMPVVMISSLTPAGSDKAAEALSRGAVEVMGKPAGSDSTFTDGTLNRKIKAAAAARMDLLMRQVKTDAGQVSRSAVRGSDIPRRRLVVIGSSTGGTEALRQIVPQLPADIPGACIVQHIQPGFSSSLATRLNNLTAAEVKEAAEGDLLRPGRILLAPGTHHLTLEWTGSAYRAHLSEDPPVHYQRPAVDVLFDSAAETGVRDNCMALLLTGMGIDGAEGMLRLRQAGATTVAQDESTSVVYGMPKEATRIGAAAHQLPLHRMADAIVRFGAVQRTGVRLAA